MTLTGLKVPATNQQKFSQYSNGPIVDWIASHGNANRLLPHYVTFMGLLHSGLLPVSHQARPHLSGSLLTFLCRSLSAPDHLHLHSVSDTTSGNTTWIRYFLHRPHSLNGSLNFSAVGATTARRGYEARAMESCSVVNGQRVSVIDLSPGDRFLLLLRQAK